MSKGHVIVLMGPPGSGKGSLAQLCKETMGWQHFSTGNLCRQHINEQTDFGKKIDFIIKSGNLVPDELICQMVGQWLSTVLHQESGVILDGYPRTQKQAIHLFEHLGPIVQSLQVVKLHSAEQKIIERLCRRYVCQNGMCQITYSSEKNDEMQDMRCKQCFSPLGRRADDQEHVVRERLQTYYMHEKNVLDVYMQRRQPVIVCDNSFSLQETFESFRQLIIAQGL